MCSDGQLISSIQKRAFNDDDLEFLQLIHSAAVCNPKLSHALNESTFDFRGIQILNLKKNLQISFVHRIHRIHHRFTYLNNKLHVVSMNGFSRKKAI